MTKVYLINKYDRWCPEDNDGDYFVAAFSTRELAEDYVRKAETIEGEDEWNGFSIREFELDTENPMDHSMVDDDDWIEELNTCLRNMKIRGDL